MFNPKKYKTRSMTGQIAYLDEKYTPQWKPQGQACPNTKGANGKDGLKNKELSIIETIIILFVWVIAVLPLSVFIWPVIAIWTCYTRISWATYKESK